MGSAAALECAQRGFSVIAFDRFSPPHSFGSHSGGTRIFRMGYAESPNYVPLVKDAFSRWLRWSDDFGVQLYRAAGLLTMDLRDSDAIQGILRSAELHNLEIDVLDNDEVRRAYPAFQPHESYIATLEHRAGWLDVDLTLQYAHRRAQRFGAQLEVEQPVISWEAKTSSVLIHTANAVYEAARLILAAGAWAGDVLRGLEIPLQVVRKTFAWFKPVDPELFAEGRIPIFGFPPNAFYGFPNIGEMGVKVAEHSGGENVVDAESARVACDSDKIPLQAAASQLLPRLGSNVTKVQVCLYTRTPDGHFVVDRHPDHPHVCYAAGFSGHGFKFSPTIGYVLADLSINGRTDLPVDFLRADRFPQFASAS